MCLASHRSDTSLSPAGIREGRCPYLFDGITPSTQKSELQNDALDGRGTGNVTEEKNSDKDGKRGDNGR